MAARQEDHGAELRRRAVDEHRLQQVLRAQKQDLERATGLAGELEETLQRAERVGPLPLNVALTIRRSGLFTSEVKRTTLPSKADLQRALADVDRDLSRSAEREREPTSEAKQRRGSGT